MISDATCATESWTRLTKATVQFSARSDGTHGDVEPGSAAVALLVGSHADGDATQVAVTRVQHSCSTTTYSAVVAVIAIIIIVVVVVVTNSSTNSSTPFAATRTLHEDEGRA
jgi:hypothetical protein